jgi:putative FmdB family regulatory protein
MFHEELNMPIYEYVCKNCKNKFELMRSFSRSKESADCPRCQKQAERILSACYSKSADSSGATQPIAGGGGGCGSCGGGNCGSCSN